MLQFKPRRSAGIRVTTPVHRYIRAGDRARAGRNWSEAATAYRAALALAPELGHIWVQLGHAQAEAGDPAAAAGAYRRAAALGAEADDALLHLRYLANRCVGSRPAIVADEAALLATVMPPGPPILSEGMTAAEMQSAIDSHVWHHSIDFGDGLSSRAKATADETRLTAAALLQNLNLRGRSLIDIGAWNGAYAFEAARRGAHVLATDHYVWRHPEFRGRETFDLGLKLTGLDVAARDIDVPDIAPESIGTFDVVLFSGVFYHLPDPIEMTRRISRCAERLLILETVQDALDVGRPAMVFYPGATLNNDATNWWGPNPRCLYEMLREFGFGEIRYRDAPCTAPRSRGIWHAFRDRSAAVAMGADKPLPEWLRLSEPAARDTLFAAL